jgi:hypothetical protein
MILSNIKTSMNILLGTMEIQEELKQLSSYRNGLFAFGRGSTPAGERFFFLTNSRRDMEHITLQPIGYPGMKRQKR